MPSFPIQLKRSGTASATPSSLVHGELAINYNVADGKLFWKDSSNVIQSFTFQAYALSSHSHGNITNAGAIGSTANLPIITTTSGVLTTGSFGTSAATFCEGNDSRLSDTRTPTDGSVTTAKIANDAVTYAKLQNVSATDRLLGRSSAGSGDVEEITCTAFGRSLIDDADAAAARSTLSVQPTASPAFTGAATFDNTGNVVPLTVTNTGTANSFVVNDASGDTTPFVVDASGNVGIGTSSPGVKLEVARASPADLGAVARFYHGPASDRSVEVGVFNSAGLNYPPYIQGRATTTTAHGLALQPDGGVLTVGGQLLVTAGSGSSGSYKPGVAVSGDDDTGLQQVGGANTISLVTAGSERVRVGSGGGVGIGTTNTTDALTVVGVTTHVPASDGSPSAGSKTYYSGVFTNSSNQYGMGVNVATTGNALLQVQRFDSSGTLYNLCLQPLGGEVLIGTTTDNGAYLLQVNSQIYATNATIATSDARFKTNVEALTDATAVIAALRPVAFDFIPHAERNFATERQVGLIAQEAQSALAGTDYADSVVAQCGDHLGLAYEKLVPVLIKALQESNARIAALEERVNHA